MRWWAALLWIVIGCTPRAETSVRGITETEAAPRVDVKVGDRIVFEAVRDHVGDRVVDADGVMWRMQDGKRVRLLDRVRRAGVAHPKGTVVVREGTEPGHSSLWLIPTAGAPRVIAPADGADDLPVVLPDGRIAFVSTRSTVASLWITTLDGEAKQLTNVGLKAGRPWEGFVPTPSEALAFADGRLVYDDGRGKKWSIDPDTGEATAR